MKLKQISLAALAATFITGAATMANAESNVGLGAPGPNTSAGLEGDRAATRGDVAVSAPSASMNAYGYAQEYRLPRPHKAGRTSIRMKHDNR